ncbi:PAAR domain-containing protein [Paraburkholderia adhaesiva]|uniref:PAAR domain-containing protein n=1 Tax=Paraburkholderia adhaesiva TaxID=2883244 RepID=UPI001F1DDDDE|nr:PAAR domain-containing protein [Paraburkholderia adhaesiva]
MSEQQQRKGEMYAFATIGARTERGGYVTRASSDLAICGLGVALVGDIVTYRDGSEAAIIDGAGILFVDDGKCGALVGSHLSNGDKIVFSPWDDGKDGVFVEDGQRPAGLFDPSYVPPLVEPGYRFAVYGSTTARGGVLCEPNGEWSVDGKATKIGLIGDLVQYSDGSTARIASGLVLTNNPAYTSFAFVGSELDNGDTITDSPRRRADVSPETFSIVRRQTKALEGGAA